MDGILNINKPEGKTSYSIVALIKRLSREKRVGHAGTLDPAATGVLPVCLGQGTRVVQYLMEATKTYRAEIELGIATDTYDATGKIIQQGDISGIDRECLEPALTPFQGVIQQTPPPYSALKHHGQPLYKLARSGIAVPPKSRTVRIYRISLLAWQSPAFTVEVECGKGTYIRSLAHDLGQSLGCGAHLKSLVRTRYGPFDIRDAVPLPQLEEAFCRSDWQQFVQPIDIVLSPFGAVVVDNEKTEVIKHGGPVLLERACESTPGERLRVYSPDGLFLAMLRFDVETGRWRPEKVFAKAAEHNP